MLTLLGIHTADIAKQNNVAIKKLFKVKRKNYEQGQTFCLKLQLGTIADVTKLLDTGIKVFWLNIPKEYVHKEDSIAIIQCFKCFLYGHYTNKCLTPDALCSICAGRHNYRKCKSTHKKCALCKGPHQATSRDCPERKKYIKSLLEEKRRLRDQRSNPNSNAQPTPLHPSPLPTAVPPPASSLAPPTNTDSLKHHSWEIQLATMTKYAELYSKGDPHIFIQVMNKFHQAHGIPVVPDPIDPAEDILPPTNPPTTPITPLHINPSPTNSTHIHTHPTSTFTPTTFIHTTTITQHTHTKPSTTSPSLTSVTTTCPASPPYPSLSPPPRLPPPPQKSSSNTHAHSHLSIQNNPTNIVDNKAYDSDASEPEDFFPPFSLDFPPTQPPLLPHAINPPFTRSPILTRNSKHQQNLPTPNNK